MEGLFTSGDVERGTKISHPWFTLQILTCPKPVAGSAIQICPVGGRGLLLLVRVCSNRMLGV